MYYIIMYKIKTKETYHHLINYFLAWVRISGGRFGSLARRKGVKYWFFPGKMAEKYYMSTLFKYC